MNKTDTTEFFGQEKISKILFKLAPPVMFAQLIQALYNIVDSLFGGKYSDTGKWRYENAYDSSGDRSNYKYYY